MKRPGPLLILTILSLLLCSINAFADEIRIGGGGAAMNAVFRPVQLHFEKATGIYMVNLQSTPKDGLIDLLKGNVDAATGAYPLEKMIEAAQKEGVDVDPSSLHQTVVGKNKTVIFAHKDNPVSNLTKEQIKGIFTGKINNWKEVGGSDRDIIIVWGRKTPGQNDLFLTRMLDGEPAIKDIIEATDYLDIKEKVRANPEGLGIDPYVIADDTVKVIETTPEIVSPIVLITKGSPSPAMQKLIEFIKGEGQQYLKAEQVKEQKEYHK